MPATQPVSRVVNVNVLLTPAAAQSQSLNTLLFLGSSGIIDPVERYRTYTSLAQVATDFGTTAEEYKAATRWFAQAPQPTQLLIGRWVETASKGGLKGGTLSASAQVMANWTAITTGAFRIVKDGAASVLVSGLNFSAAANLNAVAAIIQAGAGMPAGTTVVWNAAYGRFEFESNTTGTVSNIGYLQAPGSGTDISAMLGGLAANGAYTYAGLAAETLPAALALFDDQYGQKFYGIGITASATSVVATALSAAAYVEGAAPKRILFLTTQDAGTISSASTIDLAYQLKTAGYKRTFLQYSSTAPYAALSAAARILGVNYEADQTTITLKFKLEPGVTPENLSVTQALAAEAKNANIFIAYENNTSIIEQGVQSSGDFTDVITGADWLATTIQRDVWNLFYSSSTKIPQTDDGANLVQATVEARCVQAVANGLAAGGVWNAGGFGILRQGDYLAKGFYVYIQPMRLQTQADRAARRCPPVQVAIKLAGAIHSSDVTININQ
jgi:hypothetical protein